MSYGILVKVLLFNKDAHADAVGVIHPDGHGDCRESTFKRHSDGSASIEFIRSFETCHGEDYLIEDGTVHLVYASGSGPLYRFLHSRL